MVINICCFSSVSGQSNFTHSLVPRELDFPIESINCMHRRSTKINSCHYCGFIYRFNYLKKYINKYFSLNLNQIEDFLRINVTKNILKYWHFSKELHSLIENHIHSLCVGHSYAKWVRVFKYVSTPREMSGGVSSAFTFWIQITCRRILICCIKWRVGTKN